MPEKQVLSNIAVRKEPEWLKEYRQKNTELLEKIPLKKNNFTNSEALWKRAQALQPEEKALTISTKETTGIEMLPWELAVKEKEAEIRVALEREAMPGNRIEAFVNAHFNNGFIAIAPKNFSQKKIVEIELQVSRQCIAKNLLIAEENSQINFLEKISGEKGLLLNESILLEQNTETVFCRMHLLEENFVLSQGVVLGKDARMVNANAWLGGKEVKSTVVNRLAGQGASLQQLDLLFGKQKQFFDLSLQNLHAGSDASSYSLFKAVLEQQAKSVFDGMIKILPTGQRANALLEAHSMLLSENASSNNIPGLEIEADDVKATHSASVAQLEEEHLFYLESKGIERKNAKKLITTSFLEGVILKMPQGFHEEISSALDESLGMLLQ